MRYIFCELNKNKNKEIIKDFLLNGLIKIDNEFIVNLNFQQFDSQEAEFYLIVEKQYYKLAKKLLVNKGIYVLNTDQFKNLEFSNFSINDSEDNYFYLLKDNFLINDVNLIIKHESRMTNLNFWYGNKLLINSIYINGIDQDKKIYQVLKSKFKKINLKNNVITFISNFEDLQSLDKRYVSFEEDIIFTPGPTAILQETKNILGYGVTHHRTESGKIAIKECARNIKKSFNSKKGYPLIFVSSGTGALDSAFVNLVDENSKILIINTGFFGQLLIQMAKTYKIDYIELKYENGFSYELEEVKPYIGIVDAIFITYLETSTGVVNNIEVLGKLCKNTKTLLVTDSISALINEKFNFDSWSIDFAVGCSTKGFETSPGIGFGCVSQKALKKSQSINKKNFYYDWNRYIGTNALKGVLPSTSPINIIEAMNKSWNYIESNGGLLRIQHEKKLKWKILYNNLKNIGFENNVKNKKNYSNWLLTVKTPSEISAKLLRILLYVLFGILIECGINDESNSILRIAINMTNTYKDINYLLSSLKKIVNSLR